MRMNLMRGLKRPHLRSFRFPDEDGCSDAIDFGLVIEHDIIPVVSVHLLNE